MVSTHHYYFRYLQFLAQYQARTMESQTYTLYLIHLRRTYDNEILLYHDAPLQFNMIVFNSLPSWLAAIYAICFVGMIIKIMKNKNQYPYPNIPDKKMKHNGCEQLMLKLIIVSFIAIIVVLFVRLSYLNISSKIQCKNQMNSNTNRK